MAKRWFPSLNTVLAISAVLALWLLCFFSTIYLYKKLHHRKPVSISVDTVDLDYILLHLIAVSHHTDHGLPAGVK